MLVMKPVCGVIFVVVFVQFFNVCEPLKEGDRGACEENVSVIEEYTPKHWSPEERIRWNKPGTNSQKFKIKKDWVCCADWTYDADTDSCLPDCQPECINGKCVSPNQCVCNTGYEPEILATYICLPVCDPECVHGFCASPNNCSCNVGFEKSTKNNVCDPKCDQACTNGHCTSPNKCSCHAGYINDPNNRFTCIPGCEPACIFGKCTASNVCTCDPGYEQDKVKKYKCNPVCEKGCYNGTCISPNECVCSEGYKLTNEKNACEAPCEKPCIHGKCVGLNKCTCDPGYTEDPNDKFKCVPTCNQNCDNGVCVSPNNCKCNDGYAFEDKECKPVCAQPCTNGKCSSPNRCTCFEGYLQLPSDHTVCYKPCNESCYNGTCDFQGRCTLQPKPVKCEYCNGTCSSKTGECSCPDRTPCYNLMEIPAEVATAELASIEAYVIAPAVVGIVLLAIIIIVIQRMWYNTKVEQKSTTTPNCNEAGYGSVVCHTFSPTLMRPPGHINSFNEDYELTLEETPSTTLLQSKESAEQMALYITEATEPLNH